MSELKKRSEVTKERMVAERDLLGDRAPSITREVTPEMVQAVAASANGQVLQQFDLNERVEVTWGDELFQPLRFNGMRVGPFSASTIVRPGESVAAATVRLHREIAAAAEVITEEKSSEYLESLAGLVAKAENVRIP